MSSLFQAGRVSCLTLAVVKVGHRHALQALFILSAQSVGLCPAASASLGACWSLRPYWNLLDQNLPLPRPPGIAVNVAFAKYCSVSQPLTLS